MIVGCVFDGMHLFGVNKSSSVWLTLPSLPSPTLIHSYDRQWRLLGQSNADYLHAKPAKIGNFAY